MGAFYSQRVKARTLGYLIVGVGLAGLLLVALPHSEMVKTEADVVLRAHRPGHRRGRRAAARARIGETGLRVAVVLGIVVVSVANYLLGPVALVPIMFTWFALYVFAFFSRTEAMGYMARHGPGVRARAHRAGRRRARWCGGCWASVTPVVAGLLLSMVVRLAMDRTGVLEDSEAQTRAIIESAPNAFTTVDEDGVIMEWNREAERTFGYTAEEVVGRQVVDVIILPEDREGHFERLHAAFATSPDDPPLRGERNLHAQGRHARCSARSR